MDYDAESSELPTRTQLEYGFEPLSCSHGDEQKSQTVRGEDSVPCSQMSRDMGPLQVPNGYHRGVQSMSSEQSMERNRRVNFDHQRAMAISKIEGVFQHVADCILEDKDMIKIGLRARGSPGTHHLDHGSQSIGASDITQWRDFSFPGKTSGDAWRFTVVIRIMQTIHEALIKDSIVTKRDIYYSDPKLFIKQAVVDRYVDDIACTFAVDRACLNVVSAAKGLVSGALEVIRKDGSTFNCASDNEGALIPSFRDIQSVDESALTWILVIEKEATFRSLAANGFWKFATAGKGALITGKGYPDISSRAFLNFLSAQVSGRRRTAFLALVDYDPDGVAILSTYKYGSASLAHENVRLIAPNLCWLGAGSSDLHLVDAAVGGQGLLQMTPRDRRRATRLLDNEIFHERGPEPGWRREVQVMLMLNVKAEIQLMADAEGGLEAWLDGKITALCSPMD